MDPARLADTTRASPAPLIQLPSGTLVPSAYVCPLSWRIMLDPVLDPDDQDGRAMDREAFEGHQRQHGVRPLTGAARPRVSADALINPSFPRPGMRRAGRATTRKLLTLPSRVHTLQRCYSGML